MKSKKSTLKNQLERAIKEVNFIGQSKFDMKNDAKKLGDRHRGIHSYETLRRTKAELKVFREYLSEKGITDFKSVNENHYVEFLQMKEQQGASLGHLCNLETSITLLRNGLEKLGVEANFCTEERMYKYSSTHNINNRSYTRDEIRFLQDNTNNATGRAIELMVELGLRVKEAAYLKPSDFVEKENGKLYVNINEGAKGGRMREFEVLPHFEGRARELSKMPVERIVGIKERTIQNNIINAKKRMGIERDGRGVHGFRHTYARERKEQLLSALESKDYSYGSSVREMLNLKLETLKNGEYLHQSEIYSSAAMDMAMEVMDKVHNELGHGKERTELGTRYLAD